MIPCEPAGLCLSVWQHKRRKWSDLKDISSPAQLSDVFVSSFHFADAHFSFQLAEQQSFAIISDMDAQSLNQTCTGCAPGQDLDIHIFRGLQGHV